MAAFVTLRPGRELNLTDSVHRSYERFACSYIRGLQLPHEKRAGAFLHLTHSVR